MKNLKITKKLSDRTQTKLRISDISSRAYRIAKARKIYENISSLYDTFDSVGNDDIQKAKTSITNYMLKLEQC